MILCIWHNRLLGSILADWRAAQRCHPVKVLTSASKDGGWLAAMARRFTLGAVRGSSSRRGAAALIELSRAIRDGNDIVITPDGPRGPNYSIAPGIVHLAGRAGVRIVPVKVGFTRFWRIGKNGTRCGFRSRSPGSRWSFSSRWNSPATRTRSKRRRRDWRM